MELKRAGRTGVWGGRGGVALPSALLLTDPLESGICLTTSRVAMLGLVHVHSMWPWRPLPDSGDDVSCPLGPERQVNSGTHAASARSRPHTSPFQRPPQRYGDARNTDAGKEGAAARAPHRRRRCLSYFTACTAWDFTLKCGRDSRYWMTMTAALPLLTGQDDSARNNAGRGGIREGTAVH